MNLRQSFSVEIVSTLNLRRLPVEMLLSLLLLNFQGKAGPKDSLNKQISDKFPVYDNFDSDLDKYVPINEDHDNLDINARAKITK